MNCAKYQLKHCFNYENMNGPNQFLFLTGSVLVQMIVCGIYGIVHKLQYPLSQNRVVTRDKIDYILAFGEAVLNIGNEQPELADIKSMASDIINMESGYEFAS